MSAKIYSLPERLQKTLPNIWDMDFDVYEQKIEEWRDSVKKFCLGRRQADGYIGETIKFPVADSQAEYIVAGFKPLELLHLPVMDAWDYPNVDLMTEQRVKEMIDSDRKLQAFFDREPDEADIQEAIDRLGIVATKMTNAEITAKLDDKGKSWATPFFFVRWDDVSYLIPPFNHKLDNHEVFKYLVNKCKAHLVE